MNVRIIAKTTDALEVLYTSAKTCTSEHSPSDIFDVLGDGFGVATNDMIKTVTRVFDSGHMSVAEHVNITFAIEGISRACSHQLVRHRHCSFSQQSQRYVNAENFEFITPDSINKVKRKIIDRETNEILYTEYPLIDEINQYINSTKKLYSQCINLSVKEEDARMILPNACTTNLVMTCNLRALIHLCNERLCFTAQNEIKTLVTKMKDETIIRYPWMQKYLVSKCEKYKLCDEMRSCGKYPKVGK